MVKAMAVFEFFLQNTGVFGSYFLGKNIDKQN